MPTFLETVVERTQVDVAARKRKLPPAELEQRLGPVRRGRPFSEALIDEGISLIAEMKRAEPVARARSAPGPACRRSCAPTRRPAPARCRCSPRASYFGGSLEDLVEARAACDLPLLRKDFVVDEYQLLEARAAGADAVLLIVAALWPERLRHLMAVASDLGMDTLVEVHDEEEVETAVEAGAEVLGINNRDLHSLEVDLDTTFRLLADVPAGTVVVAESGISEREDVERLEQAGVDAILVGEVLMRADDPVRAVAGAPRVRPPA